MSENKIPLRQDADKKYMWRTEDLFPTDGAWEEKYKALESKAALMEGYKDSMTKGGRELFEALEFFHSISEELDKDICLRLYEIPCGQHRSKISDSFRKSRLPCR